ncbi:MAG: nuclear transport factor 2 family protein [Actinomycetota bacterium]|nr:nuclear transport factor 2 family protein [Actinomycetota bacterium]
MTTPDLDKEIVERFISALINDDPASIRSLTRDDITWWVPASAARRFNLSRPLTGWDNIPWLGGPGWKGFEPDSSQVHMHHLVAQDGFVSAHYNRQARRRGGGNYNVEYNMLFRLENAAIAEVWEIVDTSAAFEV